MISIYNIEEDKNGLPKQYRWNDTLYITIPSIIGKDKKETKKILQGFNIIFEGNGDKVLDSMPKENTRVKSGSTIRVILN